MPVDPQYALPIVHVVDDDADLAASVARLLTRHGYAAEPFSRPALLLEVYAQAPAHCIVTDVMMGDLDGFGFAEKIRAIEPATAIVFMTAWPTTANAVDSVRRHGGLDYLEKPLDEARLLNVVSEGVTWAQGARLIAERKASLTPREKEVFGLLVRGYSNKQVAALLKLSPKTVEDHRAQIVAKTGANGLSGLIALAD